MTTGFDDNAISRSEAAMAASLTEAWQAVFDDVRTTVHIPTVWLALRETTPIMVDGSRFVVGISPQMSYLALNLHDIETRQAIEDALRKRFGIPLVFTLIEGATVEDWEAEKSRFEEPGKPTAVSPPLGGLSRFGLAPGVSVSAGATAGASTAASGDSAGVSGGHSPGHGVSSPVFGLDAPSLADLISGEDPGWPSPAPAPAPPQRLVAPNVPSDRPTFQTWEQLADWINHSYKQAPLIKYSQGQARYILECVQRISDTMDVLMPKPGQPADPQQDKQLARAIDRVGQSLSMDPLFIALELVRFRRSIGRDING